MRLIEDFNALPSLCFLAGTQIVIKVWNRREVTRSIDRWIHIYNAEVFNRNWKEVEDHVKALIQGIQGVPQDLLQQMKAICHLVGIHIVSIRHFAYFAPDSTNSELDFPIRYWTAYGTVNIKRLEEQLARINRTDIGVRYNLACNDCFDAIVEELFNLLTDHQRADFLTFDNQRELVSYWTRRQSNDLSTFENLISQNIFVIEHNYTAHQFAFLYTLLTGNKLGIEYFLNFLSRENYEVLQKIMHI
ncbi:hypothetical protein TNIN_460271 [Trichonephila inaurata madagascariensis]|uniref:Uncharacterized protein n=1 Tax=Trichonephila inaurata madagascariensis TaxID=2747483 RepID=A0A8X6WLB2_9ARAC|nr:hypothetical protein TNIN_460271 [Trichonephila inaurata madagascariensis]